MSDQRGYYLMYRGWMTNPAFRVEPFCERAAFVWMVEEAAFHDRRRNINGRVIDIKRGQFSHSTRFMAAAWGWGSDASVRRFLNRLKTDAVIDAVIDAGQMLITLRNYDKYQLPLGKADAASDAEPGAAATQQRRSSDANPNELNELNELNLSPPERAPARAKRRTRLPSDFTMPEPWMGWALQEAPHLDIQRIAQAFINHAHATGRAMADWEAAWRMWVGKELQYGKPQQGRTAKPAPFDTARAAGAAALRRRT